MKKILLRVPRILIVGVILLILLAGSALAYLFSSTREGATSNFTPAKDSDPTINDTSFYVNVGNPGYAVYVRAAIVVNWEDASGHIHATAPKEGTDYTIDLNAEADDPWFLGDDGFYYHKAMVAYDGTDPNSQNTAVLINSCQVKDEAVVPDGYHLNVEIIAQTIQALGTTDAVDANGNPTPAVEDAWKVVTVDNNLNLTPKT